MGRGGPGARDVVTPARSSSVAYRIIKGAEKRLRDFESDAERRKRPRDDSAEMRRRNAGRSLWLSKAKALAVARDLPWLGTHLAEISVPESVTLEPFADEPLHVTAYGPTQELFDAVVQVVPVR